MEPQSSSSSPKKLSVKKIWKSFEEFKAEFSRIQWSEEANIFKTVRLIVGATFTCGLLLYGVDLVIRQLIAGLESIFMFIAG
jgi:preprotein translocase SecE subunit